MLIDIRRFLLKAISARREYCKHYTKGNEGEINEVGVITLIIVGGIALRSSFVWALGKMYVQQEISPDASRIASSTLSDYISVAYLIPSQLNKRMAYIISGQNKYPFDNMQIWKYGIFDSIFTILALAGLVFIIRRVYLAHIEQKIICFLVVALALTPGSLYASATFRSEWGSIISMVYIVWLIERQRLDRKYIVLGLVVSTIAKATTAVSLLLMTFIRQVGPDRHYNLKTIIEACNKLIWATITILFTIGLFHGNVYKDGNYLWTHYDGMRGIVNIGSNNEVYKLFAKVPVAYILDSVKVSVIRIENMNTLAARARVLIMGYIVCRLVNNKGLVLAQNRIIIVYVGMTIPIIAFTGFYQSRYFIPYDYMLYLWCIADFNRLISRKRKGMNSACQHVH